MLRLVDSAGASRVREDAASFDSGSPKRLPPVTNSEWLDARFVDDDRLRQAQGLQRSLRRLAAFQARVELVIGAGLEALHSRFDLRELGHSNSDALCTGRLGFSASHGRELRRLARRLPELPQLRDVFLAGLVPRTRVRELLDIATPEDDAAWARLAMQLTSRELKRRVRDVKSGRDPGPGGACASDEDDDLVRVSWLASGAERAGWEFGLALLRQLLGKRGPKAELAEALAAETLSGFGPPELPDGCVRSPGASRLLDRSHPRKPRRREPNRREPNGRKALRRLRRALERARDDEAAALPPLPEIESCETAWQVHDQLVALVRRLTGLESERARLLSWVQGRALYRELGHDCFHDWLEVQLGLGPRDARRLIELQSRLSALPSLEQAWQCGEFTTHQAWQLSEVAVFDTQADWMDYAHSATPKLLDAAVEQLRVAEARAPRPLPPWGMPLRALLLDWQEHFGLRRRRELRIAEGACASGEADRNLADSPRLSGVWRLGRIGFSAPASVATLWGQACQAVRAEAGTILSDADVVRRMLEHLLEVHVTEEVLAQARRHRAIERDGWTCQMPHCRSNGPFHEHHRQFRSAGGSDEESNLVTLCAPCHAMLHAGHVVVLGRAPDELTFLLGTRREAHAGERRLARAAREWIA